MSYNTEQHRKHELQVMKRWASGLLGIMTIIFVFASYLEKNSVPWAGFVRAFAEAGMVGALADWFAVVALFRHPLGLPIPHTAIIPSNKNRIGESLAHFIEENFLTAETVAHKLEKIDIATKAAEWISEEENAKKISRSVVHALPKILAAFDDARVQSMIEENFSSRIRAIEAAPLLGNVLAVMTRDGRHQALLDEGLLIAEHLLEENKPIIRQKIRQESPWYVPSVVDDKIYEKIIEKAEQTLRDVNRDPHHELRRKFHRSVQEFIEKLRTSEEFKERGEEIKEEILAHPLVRQYFSRIWLDIKTALLRDAEDEHGAIQSTIYSTVKRLGETTLADEEFRRTANSWIHSTILAVIISRREAISSLITETVQRWDAEVMSEKIEAHVGRDLQFIRINGTLVGGIVGLCIYSLSRIIF